MNSNVKAIAIGRLVPVKRFDVLIEAWKVIPNHITLVGDGSQREQLEAQVKDYGLQERVTFVGEQHNVAEMLAKHQLLVVTSEREGFGYVILEALQAELVVVSTATGIALDLLPKRYLFSNLSSAVVANTIQETLSEFDRAMREFESVWNRARSMTVQKMVSETLATYNETLSQSART